MSKGRPPLPDGPYLVVGLARSGQAAARVLAARGEVVIGSDSGHPAGAEGLGAAGVEVHLPPLEAQHLALAPPSQVRELHDGAEFGAQVP